MQVPLTGLTEAFGAVPAASSRQEPSTPTTSFASILRNAVTQVEGLENEATQAVTGLIAGNGVDLHTAMIATQKADAAFEMALSMRNKAISAYQQLMGTQF